MRVNKSLICRGQYITNKTGNHYSINLVITKIVNKYSYFKIEITDDIPTVYN